MATEIKIAAQMDTQSFRQVNAAIQQLVNTVQKLNAAMSTLGQSISKIQTGNSAPGSAAAIKQPSQSKAQGGIVGALVGNTREGMAEFDRALNDMPRKVNRAVDQTIPGLKRLAAAYREVGGGGGLNRDQQMVQFAIGNNPGWSNRAIAAVDAKRVPPKTPPLGGGFDFAGLVSGGSNAVTSLLGGNIGGFLGSTVGRLGIAGAIAYGGYKVADAFTSYTNGLYGSEQQFAINFPIQQQQAAAATLAPFKQYGMAHHNWDLRTMIGYERALTSPAGRNAFGRKELWDEVIGTKMRWNTVSGAIEKLGSPLGPSAVRAQDVAVGVLHGLGGSMLGSIGGAAGSFANLLNSSNPVAKRVLTDAEMLSNQEMAVKKLKLDMGPQRAALLQDLAQAEMAKANSAEEYMMAAYSGQGALSRVRALRAMGRSTAPIRMRDGTQREAYEWLEAGALAQGRTLADDAAEYHQVSLGIGRGFGRVFGRYGAVSAAEAGYTNIVQSAKLWGMVTGSVLGADVIEGNVNGSGGMIGGAKGVDVAVGRDLFHSIAQTALESGMYGASSLNQVNRMLGTYVAAGGVDSAAQQRNAYGYALGAQLERSMTSGTRSAFDKAASWQDAASATGVWDARTIRLQEMGATDPRLLASIAYGGAKVPQWAEGIIDKGAAQGYFESARKRTFATVVDDLWANLPKQSKVLSMIRAGDNDPNKALDQLLKGKTTGSKEWWSALDEQVQTMSGILGGNKMANYYKITEDYLRTQDLERATGPGAHAAAPKSTEQKVLLNQKLYKEALAEEMQKKGSKYISDRRKDEIARKFDFKSHMEAEKRMADANDIPALSDNFVKAASDLANAIKAKAAGKTRGAGA